MYIYIFIAAFVRCQQMILMSIEVIETSEPYTCIHYHRDDPENNTTHDTPTPRRSRKQFFTIEMKLRK